MAYFVSSNVTGNNDKKAAWVELYGFAFMPHIARCGHDDLKQSLYDDIIEGSFDASQAPDIIDALHRQLNCLGLKCEDIGRHINADDSYPECDDGFVMKGYYAPLNATETNMVRHNQLFSTSKRHVSKSSDLFAKPARLDLDAVAIHQLMSLEKYSAARDVYLNGLNYYDYDDESKFGFVSLHNLTQSETIGDTDFDTYQLYTDFLSKNPGNFVDDFILR